MPARSGMGRSRSPSATYAGGGGAGAAPSARSATMMMIQRGIPGWMPRIGASFFSVPGRRGVHRLGPGVDPARQVSHLAKPAFMQELERLAAPHARPAIGHDLVGGAELVQGIGQPAQRNEGGAREARDLPLLGLT